jgi:DNA-binding GntR family transcriptional regulator
LREAAALLADADVDFPSRVEADLRFHLQLCRLSGNSMLVETWRYLEGRIRIVIMDAGPDKAPVMMSQDRHVLIIDAIESGDLSIAVSAVDEHMSAAADHFARVSS